MKSLRMFGPIGFTSEEIDRCVTKARAGNYALGETKADGVFTVGYIGRSDGDLHRELKDRLNPKYKEFKYAYAASPTAAYRAECLNYHDFGEKTDLDNEKHPDRPDGTDSKCPICGE